MGEGADGDVVHACLRHLPEVPLAHIAAGLGEGAVVDELDALAHILHRHVVQHDDIRPGVQTLTHLVHGLRLDLHPEGMGGVAPHGADGLENAAGGHDVVVLDEHPVGQIEPVVVPAAGADGVLFQHTKPRRHLPGVHDDAPGALHRPDGGSRGGGHAGHVLDQVQRHTLPGQHRAGGAGDLRKLLALFDLVPVLYEWRNANALVHQLKDAHQHLHPAKDPVLLGPESPLGHGGGGNAALRGDIPGAQILGKGVQNQLIKSQCVHKSSSTLAVVGPDALPAGEGRQDDGFGNNGQTQVLVICLGGIEARRERLQNLPHLAQGRLQPLLRADDEAMLAHDPLHPGPQGGKVQLQRRPHGEGGHQFLRAQVGSFKRLIDMLRGASAEDQALQHGVGGQPVGPVDAGGGRLAAGVEPRHRRTGVQVRLHAAHHVVVDGADGDIVVGDVDPVLQALGVDGGKALGKLLLRLMGDVDEDMALAALAHLVVDAPGHDIPGCQLGQLVLAHHEPLAFGVFQKPALAPDGFGDEECPSLALRRPEARGVELDELHPPQLRPGPDGRRQPVAGGYGGVGAGGEDLPDAAGTQHQMAGSHSLIFPVLVLHKKAGDALVVGEHVHEEGVVPEEDVVPLGGDVRQDLHRLPPGGVAAGV